MRGGWVTLPQATVQAALASLPGEAIARAYPVGTPGRERYVQWGVDAQVTAVFEILISGTLGCLMVRWITPKLLKQVNTASSTSPVLPIRIADPVCFCDTNQKATAPSLKCSCILRLLGLRSSLLQVARDRTDLHCAMHSVKFCMDSGQGRRGAELDTGVWGHAGD